MPNHDWIVVVVGYAVLVAGAVLLLRSLFADRARGRARCPKCWYLMAGIAPVAKDDRKEWTCPECGVAVKLERYLYRTRRHKMAAGVGVLLLLAGYCTLRIPDLRRGGWVRVMPSSLLVLVTPTDERRPVSPGTGGVAVTKDVDGNIVLVAPAGGPPSGSVSVLLCAEAWRRFDQGELAPWQSRLLVRRFLGETQRSLTDFVSVPSRWIAGRDLLIHIEHRNLFRRMGGSPGTLGIAGTETWMRRVLMPVPEVADSVTLDVELRGASGGLLHSQRVTVPVRITATPSEAFDHTDSSEANALVREALDIRIVRNDSGIALVIDDRVDHPRWNAITFGVGFNIEILFDGEVVGRSKGEVSWNYPVFKEWSELPRTSWSGDGLQRVLANPERAKFVVTGDPNELFEQYARTPFDHPTPTVWTGRFETPVRIDSKWKRWERR